MLGKGVTCDKGIHRKQPTDADRAHWFFKRMEKEHGDWAPNKFKYTPKPSDATPAAPAKTGVGTNGNAGHTPPGSPTAGGTGR